MLYGILVNVVVCLFKINLYFSTLIVVGPCALEYTKLKTSDHFWTDPSANELVQRHRIHGAHRSQEASPSRRPALGVRESSMRGVDGQRANGHHVAYVAAPGCVTWRGEKKKLLAIHN